MKPKRVNGSYRFEDYPDFRPNLSPREMFKLGIHNLFFTLILKHICSSIRHL